MKTLLLLATAAAAHAAHPQLMFDSDDWARMQASAAANTADWQALKARCDAYLNAVVRYPSPDGVTGSRVVVPGTSGTNPDGGLGDGGNYQGDEYYSGATALGACYQALFPSDPAAARRYAKKAREIVLALTEPPVTMTAGANTYFIVTRAAAGRPYTNTFYWDPANAAVRVGDIVTIAGSRGCANINGAWTVTALNPLTFADLPLADGDCANYGWNYTKDANFGFRFYGRALTRLYDWIYPELSDTDKERLTVTMKNFVGQVIRNGYGTQHPESNYAAAYTGSMAHCYAAWRGDDSGLSNLCKAQWTNNFLGPNKKRDYFNRWMAGGGDGEGMAGYGYGSIIQHVQAVMILRALGEDLRKEPYNFNYCEDQANYFLRASKPDRVSLDEQEYVYFNNISTLPENPTVIPPDAFYPLGWCVARQGSSSSPYFQHLINYIIQSARDRRRPPSAARKTRDFLSDPVDRFLFYDASRSSATPETLPLSYRAWGGNFAVARSGWGRDAVVLEFQGGPSTGDAGNGKTQWQSGAIAIWNGASPFVVFGGGERSRSFDVMTAAQADAIHNERSRYFNRKVSVFAADRPGSNFTRIQGLGGLAIRPPGGAVTTIDSHPTRIDLAEDTGTYAYYRSVGLQSVYLTSTVDNQLHVQSWTRELFFVRPKVVIVRDETTAKFADDDRAMFWTFGRDVSRLSTSPSGQLQFQALRSGGESFVGQLTTILPTAATARIENHCLMTIAGAGASAKAVCAGDPLNFLYRVEVRPPQLDHTNDTWLTVLDAATSPGAVENVVAQPASNADVAQLSTTGVVAFAKPSRLPVSYSFTGSPRHLLAGLTPRKAYHVAIAGSKVTVTAATGSGDLVASPAGILSFDSTGAQRKQPPMTSKTVPERIPNGQ